MTLFITVAANLLVGLCIGLTGIAGFLLPMFYSGFLGYPSALSLSLSFAAFLISGVLGSVNYYRSGNLKLSISCILSLGSILGAFAGVRLNLLIPEVWIRTLLYLVVLGSGISILIRERSLEGKKKDPHKNGIPLYFYVPLGLVTGAVCAASGAGGPVLVMPLLTMCGFPAHMAVGIALFNSIFIALPASVGYFQAAAALGDPAKAVLSSLPLLLLFHGTGVFAGSRYAAHIDQKLLKIIVAIASIVIACVKLAGF